MTLLHRPSIPLNKSLTILKVTHYYCYHYTRPSTTTRVLVRSFTFSYSTKPKYAWRTFCAEHSTVWAKLLRTFTCYLSATLCTPTQHDSKLKIGIFSSYEVKFEFITHVSQSLVLQFFTKRMNFLYNQSEIMKCFNMEV